jgi:hypothetical protein
VTSVLLHPVIGITLTVSTVGRAAALPLLNFGCAVNAPLGLPETAGLCSYPTCPSPVDGKPLPKASEDINVDSR